MHFSVAIFVIQIFSSSDGHLTLASPLPRTHLGEGEMGIELTFRHTSYANCLCNYTLRDSRRMKLFIGAYVCINRHVFANTIST